MSDTEQRQRVKPGDVVQQAAHLGEKQAWQVLRTHERGVEAVKVEGYYMTQPVVFLRWAEIDLPEPPKAKPGVRYVHVRGVTDGRFDAIGLADGRLWSTLTHQPMDFTDGTWRELP